MKSRIALAAVLACGIFMSGTGATLAVTGLSGSGNATSAQYSTPGEEHSNNNSNKGGEVLGTTEQSPAPSQGVQATRQVSASSGSSLPFTGYVAIPVLLIGVVLIGTGIMLRRRAARDDV
jgi:hypothetical protein